METAHTLNTFENGFDDDLNSQLAELQTRHALVRTLSSTLDLSAVLNQIVDAAASLTKAEEAMLLLPDEAGTALYIRAMKGVESDRARNFRIKTGDSLAGRVLIAGQPILISDQGPQKVKTEYFVQSLLYVPLTFKGRTIGVLGVNNRLAARKFTLHDQELLLDLASQAAIALENARLYERQVAQTQHLTTLVEIGRAVNSTLALDFVLISVCQSLIRALGVSGCLIGQRQQNPAHVQMLAASRRLCWPVGEGPLPEDALFQAMLSPVMEHNAYATQHRESSTPLAPEIINFLDRSGSDEAVVIPLRLDGQPIGIVALSYAGRSNHVPPVSSHFRQQVRGLAAEIVAATGERSIASIQAMIQAMLDQTHANWSSLWFMDDQQRLRQVFDFGDAAWPNGRYSEQVQAMFDLRLFNLTAPLGVTANDDHFSRFASALGIQAVLHLPMILRDTAIGLVSLYDSYSPRRFSDAEIELAQAIVAHTATAVENARLYRDLESSLTELKATQARLVQAARLSAIGELAAVVAHQIDNPLTAVLGSAEMLLQDVPPSDPSRESVETIHRAGKRAQQVVSRLLSLARNAPGNESPQPLDLNTTIQTVLDLVTAYIQRGNITLNINLSASPVVVALPGQLEDVWLNLLVNARYAVNNVQNGTIWIRSWQEDGEGLVMVADNGTGIPPEYESQLFKAFFTTKPPGEGTGLGLYICKQIVDRVGGTINLRSSVGRGTEFTIRLPLAHSADSVG